VVTVTEYGQVSFVLSPCTTELTFEALEMKDLPMQDLTLTDQIAGVENARPDNGRANFRVWGGK